MYDARAVQLNLPNYMVRQTGARSGGYEVWRKSALECNRYFLDKLWYKIAIRYDADTDKEELQRELEAGLKEKKTGAIRKILKEIYFYVLYHI